MPIPEKTVFISYRRTNVSWALFVYQNLTHNGYDVFIDFKGINSGNFETKILANIKARAHFLVILTPSALEDCKNPGDWLRREIETALDEKRNIVPLMVDNFDFGSPLVKEALTGKLAALSSINGLNVPAEYAFEAMDRLRKEYLNVALCDVALPELQPEGQRFAEIEKAEAAKAAPVQEEQLAAQTWFERGYVFYKDKKLEEAVRCYTEAIRLDPGSFVAFNNLGNVLSDLNRYEEAEAAYRKAIELDPTDAAVYTNLGVLLGELKRYEEAEAAYRKAIELAPADAAAHTNLGVLLGELKRYEEAEAAYRKAIELAPADAKAYYNLGNLLKEQKRYEEAEAAYRKAIELDSSDAKAYINLGDLLGNLKRYEEGEAACRKAIELAPTETKAYNNLGILLRITGRPAEAISVYERSIEIIPDDFNAYIGIASINKSLGVPVDVVYVEKALQYMPEDDFYNLACLESIRDRFDSAFEYLRKAIRKETFDPDWAWKDPDLQWVRSDPRFEIILGPKPDG